ncbi:phosphate propanoyltransferase [Anaerofustis butyriciformans]|uniref:phosphate propanoyltransferase n=1 Tax=Anaerofustis TaxID=264995 RepID=UPI002E309171|nr:phosphate propanoyltransferase [Anaerofustis sp. HA2171]
MKTKVPVGLSNKHVHLSRKDIDALFGEGYELTIKKPISQPGQFAAEEFVDVVGPKGTIKMRVLGPARPHAQIEILASDTFKLGVPKVIRDSWDLDGTPGCILRGPKGEVEIDKGVIVASRHIHMTIPQAKEYGVKDGDIVKVRVPGERGLIFENVLIRSNERCGLEMHIDIEEGNAAGCKNGDMLEIIRD